MKDLRTDEVTLISEGGPGNPYVTNDGDVVFFSSSSDLVAQDTNGLFDIFPLGLTWRRRDASSGTFEAMAGATHEGFRSS